MKVRLARTLLITLILAACAPPVPPAAGADQSGISTIVAATFQALTQAAPQGVKVAFENVSFVIPPDMGVAATSAKTDNIEYPPCANPSCVYPETVMPQHIVMAINGYPLAGEARVVVFKASEYANIGESMDIDITELQSLKSRPESIQDRPRGSHFQVRTKYLDFQNGYGLGSLTQFNGGPVPISNAGIFYYFQGLTNDGQYYIFAILPTSAPFLVADSERATVPPAEAVPFDWESPGDFDLVKYYEAVAQQITAAVPESFSPDLNQIEELIQSLQVTP